MLSVVSLTEDESTANIGALIWKREPLCGPLPNFGAMPTRWLNVWLFPVIREKKRLEPQPSIAQALDFRR